MIETKVRAFEQDLRALRRDLHAHPELCFQEHRTSAVVADHLRRYGFEVTAGLASTGVVGTLRNGTSNRAIAIRADMDALPFEEETGLPYRSKTSGIMHACGHDGHTTMLLGLARYLNENRNFNGIINLIFQPAEEDVSGAKRLVDEGLFQRFPVDQVFALHNLPGLAVGQVAVRAGAITAAVDIMNIRITGVAGHGAMPHLTVDPIVAASSLVLALQTVVSRTNDSLDPAVLTVGAIHGGSISTAIPSHVDLQVSLRTTNTNTREQLLRRAYDIIHAQAQSFGCSATIDPGDCVVYPACINDAEAAAQVRDIALELGQDPVSIDLRGPYMFSEDFAFMLEQVPGCFFCIGNGNSRNLHDPAYDFNDDLLVPGVSFWARLVERVLST